MSSLSEIPFLSGYMQQGRLNRENELGDLRQAAGAQSLMANMRAQREAEQDRSEMERVKQLVAQSGGDPRKAIQALNSTGNLKAMKIAAELQRSLPEPDKPQLVTVQTPQGPMQKWMRPGETSGVDVGIKPAAPKEQSVSNLRRLYQEMEALPPGDPQRETYKNAIRKESETAKQISPTVVMPQPVTPVTIADPNDPNSTVVIDGRTKQVLGKGPKLTQTGAADQKLILAAPQAKMRVKTLTQNLDRLDAALADLDKDPGLPNITGTFMGRTPNITNKATGAQAKLDSIKSQIFQSSLQAMREASKTGGALGNTSDREGDKMERTLAALDQAQGTPAFKNQLKIARDQLKLSKEIIHRAYEEQFGSVQAPAQNGGWKVTPVSQ